MDRLSRADLVVSKKKKKGQRCIAVVKFRLQSPSKPTLLVGVQNFTIFSVLETARGVVFTARRGQNNCAAAHARSLEGTLPTSPSCPNLPTTCPNCHHLQKGLIWYPLKSIFSFQNFPCTTLFRADVRYRAHTLSLVKILSNEYKFHNVISYKKMIQLFEANLLLTLLWLKPVESCNLYCRFWLKNHGKLSSYQGPSYSLKYLACSLKSAKAPCLNARWPAFCLKLYIPVKFNLRSDNLILKPFSGEMFSLPKQIFKRDISHSCKSSGLLYTSLKNHNELALFHTRHSNAKPKRWFRW